MQKTLRLGRPYPGYGHPFQHIPGNTDLFAQGTDDLPEASFVWHAAGVALAGGVLAAFLYALLLAA